MATRKENKAIADVFGSATIAKVPEKAGRKGKEKEAIEMDKPFDTLVHLSIVLKAIEGPKEQLTEQFKTDAFKIFFEKMVEQKVQPETFNGVCYNTKMAFEYRKKGAGFSDDIAEKLKNYDVSFDRTEEDRPERFVINPEFLANQELLGKLALFLRETKEFAGIEVIQKQEADYKNQINDQTIKDIIEKVKSKDEQMEFLKAIASVAAARPKIDGSDDKDPNAVVKSLRHLEEVGILNFGKKKGT